MRDANPTHESRGAGAEHCCSGGLERAAVFLCRYHRKFKDLEALSHRGMLCMSAVPVCTAGEAMGCIIVANKEADHFTQDDQVRLQGQSLVRCCMERGAHCLHLWSAMAAPSTRSQLLHANPPQACQQLANTAPAIGLTHPEGQHLSLVQAGPKAIAQTDITRGRRSL